MNISKYLCILCFIGMGCISEIDLELEGTPRISIGGVISNSSEERIIRIRQTSGFDSLSTPVSASGFLLRDGEIRTELEEITAGVLRVPQGEVILPGFTYQIQIRTAEGREFLSIPQSVKPAFSLDSMSFDIIPATVQDDDGTVRPTNLVRVFAHLTLPDVGSDEFFFRWQIENSYIFRDARTVDCYVKENDLLIPAALLRGQDIGPGPAKVQIASRELDLLS